jgi:hypothetical protein
MKKPILLLALTSILFSTLSIAEYRININSEVLIRKSFLKDLAPPEPVVCRQALFNSGNDTQYVAADSRNGRVSFISDGEFIGSVFPLEDAPSDSVFDDLILTTTIELNEIIYTVGEFSRSINSYNKFFGICK